MKSKYEPVPVLAASNNPVVLSATGLGTGGGASLFAPQTGLGDIKLFVGKGYSASGNVALQFPSAPPALYISGDEQFGPLTQSTVGNVVTISWTAARFSSPSSTETFNIHFEWNSSA